jgi:chorismate dehydratase
VLLLVFGKIDYLNLLPFNVFIKRFAKTTRHHMSINYKKGVPSKINRDFHKRRVDSAFISSVEARKYTHNSLGIIAKKEVLSVIVLPNNTSIKDSASATSNALAKVLSVEGEVVIGDRALKMYLDGIEHIDLAKVWSEKYHLPFVFALLCFHNNKKLMKQVNKEFLKYPQKIPQYILQKASHRSNIEKKQILNYLKYISYEVDVKAKKALKKFYKLV